MLNFTLSVTHLFGEDKDVTVEGLGRPHFGVCGGEWVLLEGIAAGGTGRVAVTRGACGELTLLEDKREKWVEGMAKRYNTDTVKEFLAYFTR